MCMLSDEYDKNTYHTTALYRRYGTARSSLYIIIYLIILYTIIIIYYYSTILHRFVIMALPYYKV